METFLTPKDVAEILRVSRRKAYDIMNGMPHLDSPLRVTERHLIAWVNERMVIPEGRTTHGIQMRKGTR